jgi:hypothetical protein
LQQRRRSLAPLGGANTYGLLKKALKISANSIVLICIKGREKSYKSSNDLHLMPNREYFFANMGLHQKGRMHLVNHMEQKKIGIVDLHQKQKHSSTNLSRICTRCRKIAS